MAADPLSEATGRVKAAARAEGFDLVGVAAARPLDPQVLDRFLAQGWDADLRYVRESRDERLDPSRLLPGVKSVVAVAVSYAHAAEPPPEGPHGLVARYARGRDYHNVLNRPLRRLRALVEREVPGSVAYTSCDFRPVMEKVWAERAGLGWTGRNGCFIAPPHGSWVVLGAVLTTAALVPDAPHPPRCGTCDACRPACPTDALATPGFVDCRRCIAYHTIEHRDSIPLEIEAKLGDRLFGCDACQDPCPWNRRARPGGRLSDGLRPAPGRTHVPLARVLEGSDEDLERFVAGTPLARAGVRGLRRTAQALARRRPEPK